MLESVKPNVLILAIVAALVVYVIGDEQLAFTFVGALGTAILLLAGPKPNPKVSRDFALAITGHATSGPSDKTVMVAVWLSVLAAIVIVLVGILNMVTGDLLGNIVATYIGGVGTLAGKLAAPDDSDTVPESTVLAALHATKSG